MNISKAKRVMSMFLAIVLCAGCFAGLSTTAFADYINISQIDYPRLWDADSTGWGHPDLYFMGGYFKEGHNHGWTFLSQNDFSGRVLYCLEPGVAVTSNAGRTDYGENYWDNYPSDYNVSITPSEIKSFIGRILTYGYQGSLSDNWSIYNDTQANNLAQILATQLLIWETVVGERDSEFNHVDAGQYGYDNVTDLILWNHPLWDRIFSYYDSMVAAVKANSVLPSFMSRTETGAQVKEFTWNGSNYTLELTDTNNVLGQYNFTSNKTGVSFSVKGNVLAVTSENAPIDTITITASLKNASRSGIVVWGDGNKHGGGQDVCYSGAMVPDKNNGFVKAKVSCGSVKIVKTSEDNAVSGITFTFTGEGVNQTLTTDANGTIRVDNLMPGTYTITEQAYDKYEEQEVKRVTVTAGQTATVSFNNTLKRGSLVVTKTSEDGLNEGVKFHLYGTSISGMEVNSYAVTDSSGVAKFDDVLIGNEYTLEEVETASKYIVPANQSVAINWNETASRSFHNVLKKWNVTVTKSDAETGTPRGDASLAGAVYGLYLNGQLLDSYTTDENGSFTTDYYVCGSGYFIKEITPSEGYLLDTNKYSLEVNPDNFTVEKNSLTLDVTEQISKGSIAIIKHMDNGETKIETPEENAVFAMYLKSAGEYEQADPSECDYLTTDADGFCKSKELPYGTYTVIQLSGAPGTELMPAFDVYVSEDGECYKYLINNAAFESYLKIVKTDAESGSTIPYAGAGFQIFRPDGSQVVTGVTYPERITIDTFYTGSDGSLITPEKLAYGEGYKLVEVAAPYGYVCSDEPISFNIKNDSASDENGITVVEVRISNKPQKGIIEIYKSGEVFASVTESEGIYQPVYKTQGMSGAVYEITAAEDITTKDGTLRYSAGDVVDTVTTVVDGKAESKELYLGKYNVREVKAPAGFLLDETVIPVELSYAGQEVEVTQTAVSVTDIRQKAAVTLTKIMEQDKEYGIGFGNEINAVSFGIYAAEEAKAADGNVIPKNGLIEIFAVSAEKRAEISTDLPIGEYYIKEVSTDSHYVLSDVKYPVSFKYEPEKGETVSIAVNGGSPIVNELIYGEIEILKTDAEGKGLTGAEIGLYADGKLVKKAVSDASGHCAFTNVPAGVYIVKETAAPAGYAMNDTPFSVIIGEDKQVIEITIVDDPIIGSVQLTKVDKDYPDHHLSSATFRVYADTNANKAYERTDELVGTMEELTDGVYRLDKLPYGGYFVKETVAPAGFLMDDNYYYFEISQSDVTVTVANDAKSLCFIDVAQTGSLRIEKTSEDKVVEGFSFKITSADGSFSKIVTTDKNGAAAVEGLRVGDYTISEVENDVSKKYAIPADKTVTIHEGKTTVAEFYNKLKPVTPDVPKTGDTTHPFLWGTLTGVFTSAFLACLAITAGGNKRGKHSPMPADSELDDDNFPLPFDEDEE